MIQFAEQPRNRSTITSRPMRFDMICQASRIEHRLTKPNHPWSLVDQKTVRGAVSSTNGQVERMNRAIKEGEADQKMIRGIVSPPNVKRFHYDSHDQLRAYLAHFLLRRDDSPPDCRLFLLTYNFARRLKTLNGLTSYEYICKIWTSEPDRFILDPIQQMPGPNT